MTHSSLSNVLFSFQLFACFLLLFLLLSSTFNALWSDRMHGIISIFLYLLRLALWMGLSHARLVPVPAGRASSGSTWSWSQAGPDGRRESKGWGSGHPTWSWGSVGLEGRWARGRGLESPALGWGPAWTGGRDPGVPPCCGTVAWRSRGPGRTGWLCGPSGWAFGWWLLFYERGEAVHGLCLQCRVFAVPGA
jgi:hypothetical protein